MIRYLEKNETETLNYTTVIEASEKAYDEVSRYLGEASHHNMLMWGKMHYFFDEEEKKAVRTDGKRIEISDLIE